MIYLKRKIIFILSLIGLCLPVISQADWVSHTALPASNIRVITYDAGNSTYYAGASDFPSPGVYSKTESGTTWPLVGPESGDAAYYGDVRSLLRASNTLYVGGANTVYQKADTDAGWTQVGNNITNPISLVRYNDTLIAAAAGGVFTLNLTSPSATWTRLGPASGSGSLTSAANLYLAFPSCMHRRTETSCLLILQP
ncbi:MAG: hypothetical protein IPJ69_12880 [Deltaproteobacteria bacterium]|nr:MAG: hypothetical protein IPJ69_12880 [Deltaproteobacteria bacterium]